MKNSVGLLWGPWFASALVFGAQPATTDPVDVSVPWLTVRFTPMWQTRCAVNTLSPRIIKSVLEGALDGMLTSLD